MKVFIATGLYPPETGGPATYTKLIEQELPKYGIAVFVLPFSVVRHLPSGVRHVAYFFKILRRARGADIIYAQDPVSVGLPAYWASLTLGKKFMVRVPGDYAWEQGRQRFGVTDELDEFQTNRYGWRVELLRTIQKFVVRNARAVVVPSEYMERIVSKCLVASEVDGTYEKKVRVIYSSIETPNPTPVKRPEGFLIISAGRRVPWKGFEALEGVVAREPSWHLYIASGLPRAEALGWMQIADVFVMNSTYEGLSHQLIEAMALGTPVVATNVGGNPELIRDGIEGLLVPPKDDEALYAAIKKIADEPAAARARAAAAQLRAQDFSINNTIGKLIALLKNVCVS